MSDPKCDEKGTLAATPNSSTGSSRDRARRPGTIDTFHIANFGCRASQSEGGAIHEELTRAGVAEADSPYEAGVVVINSCTVTEEADRDVRRLIRRVARRNPGAPIVVTGCYAQRRPAELAAMPQVRYVVGNSHKPMVAALVREALEDPGRRGRAEVFCSDIFAKELGRASQQGSSGRTRVTVKVQDGCDANCTFCIIPSVRGRSRSLPAEAVIGQVVELVERGYREVVFSGIHLGSYGRDLAGRATLTELVRSCLDAVPRLERLRLSSIEPLEVTDDVIDLVASHPRVAHHLHIPLQSGSHRVLRAMRRPYSPSAYGALLDRVRSAVPDAALGADVMVGFPGETDDDFMETFRLIEGSPLTYLHVFPYSARPGTVAAGLADPVPEHVARFRGKTLRSLAERKNADFRKTFEGRQLSVLVLDEAPEDGWRSAISDNFLRIQVPEGLEVNRWQRLTVSDVVEAGLQASSTTTAAETN